MIDRLLALLSFERPARRNPRRAIPTRPCLEVLEDRTAPSASIADSLFPPQNGVSFIDRLYLTHEAQGNQQETILGLLAMQKGSPAVQLFGFILMQDHTHAQQQLAPVFQSAGLPLPFLSQQNVQNIQSLASLSGQKFDDQFTTFMVQDHIEDLTVAFAEEQAGMSVAVKDYAMQSIPILDTHLLIALALQPGGQQGSSSSQG